MSDNNDKFIRDIRQALDESLEEIDGATSSRLNQARQKALESGSKRKSRLFIWGSVPAAVFAVVLLVLFWPVAPVPQPADPDLGDLHILTSTESLEFYQEEAEFYEWLSEVLEDEKELSGDDKFQSVDANAGRFAGTAGRRPGSAEYRNDRISRLI